MSALLAAAVLAAAPGGKNSKKPPPRSSGESPQPEGFSVLDLDDLPVPRIFSDLVKLSDIEKLGKQIFFDTTLSDPAEGSEFSGQPGEACATCHRLETGFMGPSSKVNIIAGPMPGAVYGRVGKRIPPSISYITYSPIGPFMNGTENGAPIITGGLMWDGRFRTVLDLGAFVDPNEQANVPTPSANNPPLRQGFSKLLADKIAKRPYAKLFTSVFGAYPAGPTAGSNQAMISPEESIFTNVMLALEAYIASAEVNPFSSKFDAVNDGKARFTAGEQRGHDLFFGKAGCSNCHSSADLDPKLFRIPVPGNRELFTAFCFVNTGVPKNPTNPFYHQQSCALNPQGCNPDGTNFIDPGLAGNAFGGTDGTAFLGNQQFQGLFLVPTLRNVNRRPDRDFVKAFFHNGSFKSLEKVVHFYNERNVAVSLTTNKKEVFDLRTGPPAGFISQFLPPENLANVQNVAGNTPADADDGSVATNGELGNLQLSFRDEADLVSFLKTLDDGFTSPVSGSNP